MTTSKCPHGRTVGKTDGGTFVCLKCLGVDEERRRVAGVLDAAKRLLLAAKVRGNRVEVPGENLNALVTAIKTYEAPPERRGPTEGGG
jgi:hypothetical protein